MYTPPTCLETRVVDGIRIYDSHHGTTAEHTLVLLHGLGNSLDYWSGVVPYLSDHARAIALDMPGYGRSREPNGPFTFETIASTIIDLMRCMDLFKATVVAHSLGGMVALHMARDPHAGHYIDSITLVDATLFNAARIVSREIPIRHAPKLAMAVAVQFLGGALAMHDPLPRTISRFSLLRRVFLWPFVKDPADLDAHLTYLALRHNTGRNVWRVLGLIRRTDIDALLQDQHLPMDILWGADDRLILDSDITEAQRCLPIRDVQCFLGTGHWPMIEAPERLAAAIVVRHH